MTRLLSTIGLACALAACHFEPGERCNPNLFENACEEGRSCVYPTGPSCGVSYCCLVDDSGKVVDPHPNCQPDPTAAEACGLDLGIASVDAAERD